MSHTFRRHPMHLKAPHMSKAGELTVSLPLPHKCLSPNARVHWATKGKHTKAARNRARLEVIAAAGMFLFPEGFSRYRLAFFHPDARARDDDNAAASCKAYRDGIADALKMDDSNIRHTGETVMAKDAGNPRVEITLIP